MDGELWMVGAFETGSPSPRSGALAVGFLLLDVSDASPAGVRAPGRGGGARTPIDPAFVAVVVTTVGILAPSYHYLVRFTAIGRLLNGRRSRDDDARLRAQLEILGHS